jgi:hypothetical protein
MPISIVSNGDDRFEVSPAPLEVTVMRLSLAGVLDRV